MRFFQVIDKDSEQKGGSGLTITKQIIELHGGEIQVKSKVNIPLKKIGKILILSIVLAVNFYALIIIAVGYLLNPSEIVESQAVSEIEAVTAEDSYDAAVEAAMDAVSESKDKYAAPPIDFSYFLTANIVFGSGKVKQAGEITSQYGNKALIVTGKSSAKKSGLYDKVKNSLKESGIDSVLFDKVSQNPLTTTAEEGAAFAKENGCNVVVAIGGGSIMDCAKGIAFMALNSGDINDYIFNRKQSNKALPLILIPTTCGTGSEGN